MGTRRVVSFVAMVLLAASCSGGSPGPATGPTTPPRHWEYTDLTSISRTFVDSFDPGLSRPDGYDAAGVELWNSYRDADVTSREQTSEDDQAVFGAIVEAAKALFVHAYSTGVADMIITADIDNSPSVIVESSLVPFTAGRPTAVSELDSLLEREGCDGIKGEYYVWFGQTTIDEVAGRATVFARYALDRAAAAGCDWAFTELVQHALHTSGLD